MVSCGSVCKVGFLNWVTPTYTKETNNIDLKQEKFLLFRLPDLVFLGQCHGDIKKNKVYFIYSIFGITMTEKLFMARGRETVSITSVYKDTVN